MLVMWFGLWTQGNLESLPAEGHAKHNKSFLTELKHGETNTFSYYIPGKDKGN